MIRLGTEHMIRALRIVSAAALLIMPFALATTAAAQTCPALDPTCTASQATEDGQRAVGDDIASAGDAAGDAGGAAHDTAQGAVDGAQQTVDQTVGSVRDTIDDALGNSDDGPPGDGGDGHEGHGGNGANHDGSGYEPGVNGGRTHLGAGAGHTGTWAGVTVGATTGLNGRSTAPPTDPSANAENPVSSSTIGQVATGVIRGAAVMALLLSAVAAFLAVQDRLDRRDPKLAPAMIGSDRVRFA
jgi:hypothetical protein